MPRLFTAGLRRCSLVLAIALLSALVAPTQAIAGAPVTTPTITAPTDGATVTSSPVSVAADSVALYVRFGVGIGPAAADFVEVSGGEAAGSLEVLGLNGPTIVTAADCDVTENCNPTDDSISVDINLTAPSIQSPKNDAYVRNGVDVNASAPGGSLQYYLDGNEVGNPVTAPFDRRISLDGVSQGRHEIRVRQCNTAGDVCSGKSDSIDVIKDTNPPRWTDVRASNKTVFPVNDNYKDSTRLSARLSESVVKASIEIRKVGGPIVRTLNLGREGAGNVAATWNGRKANGDIAPSGRYTFRFIGKDRSGLTGRSDAKNLQVSGKELVRKTVTKTVSAKGSFVGNGSGDCSDVYRLDYPQSRYGWKSGAGYYSRSRCNGTRAQDLAMGVHRVAAPKALKHLSVKVDTYGGGAFMHAGPGIIAYVNKSGGLGKGRQASAGLGWHGGPTAKAGGYLKNGKMTWVFATVQGNWFDVKEFRVSFRVAVLR